MSYAPLDKPAASTSDAQRDANSDKRDANTDKVKAKLDKHFADGQFYEAEQLYSSLYNRLSSRQKYDEAAALLQEGIIKLLDHKQDNAGSELAKKLVECYGKAETKVSPTIIETLAKIANSFPTPNSEARVSFLKAAITWTSKAGSGIYGDPKLNHIMATMLSDQMKYGDAQRYWLRSNLPEQHAQVLAVWARRGYLNERDLFICRAVLQYLCMENMSSANIVLNKYMAQFPTEKIDTPLVHFVRFLMRTLERNAQPLFDMLRQRYAPSIARDSSLASYLDKIGQVYFNIQPPKGMLEDILSMVRG